MTLTRLLGVERSLLRLEAEASLALAERIWAEHGCPAERRALADVLETVLRRCVREGICYAPILLQRKKALERGTWMPPAGQPGGDAPTNRSGDGVCAACGGTGYIIARGGGSASLCACGAWKRNAVRAGSSQPDTADGENK